jgi:transposase
VGQLDGLDLNEMFGAALGLAVPWQVISVEFDEQAGRLDLGLDFPRGERFGCPETGCAESGCAVHDTVEKTWRHLDFFQHQGYLHARVPRVRCVEHGVDLVNVQWARPGSGFTLLFEVAMLTYAKAMPIAPLARMAREHDTRIWRIVEYHVNTARAGLDFCEVSEVGMDETSARRGQDYVSIFMDLQERRVMFATEGRDALTVKAFAADLKAHGGEPTTQIERVCADMSPAFIKGIKAHLGCEPQDAEEGEGIGEAARAGHQPQIVFDRYHVVAKANEAVDEVRRAEAKTRPELNAVATRG